MRRAATESYRELLQIEVPILRTREAATRLGLSVQGTVGVLKSLERAGLVRRFRHGWWLLRPDIEPFAIAPYLTAPFPAYVSFWSALARHGMIEQIPRQIFVASPHRRQTVDTALGTYSIHQIVPELFDGFTGDDHTGYLAIPEKALFDTIYLRAPRGARIFLPELLLPGSFDTARLETWVSRISRARLRTLVERGLETAVAHADREHA